jgi:hypothetical protein
MLIWQQMNIYLHKIMSFNHEAPHTKLIRQELQTIRGDGFVEQKKAH